MSYRFDSLSSAPLSTTTHNTSSFSDSGSNGDNSFEYLHHHRFLMKRLLAQNQHHNHNDSHNQNQRAAAAPGQRAAKAGEVRTPPAIFTAIRRRSDERERQRLRVGSSSSSPLSRTDAAATEPIDIPACRSGPRRLPASCAAAAGDKEGWAAGPGQRARACAPLPCRARAAAEEEEEEVSGEQQQQGCDRTYERRADAEVDECLFELEL